MSTQHVEFPELTQESKECLVAAYKVAFPWHKDCEDAWTESNRIYQATFLREAVLQVFRGYKGLPSYSYSLLKMADNLHSPPPAPPTREQMNEALQKLAMRPHPFSNPSTYYSLVQEHLKTLQQGIAYHCKE